MSADSLPAGEAPREQAAPVAGTDHDILVEILAELKRHHNYIRERDKFLDALEERDAEERETQKAKVEAAVEQMLDIGRRLEP